MKKRQLAALLLSVALVSSSVMPIGETLVYAAESEAELTEIVPADGTEIAEETEQSDLTDETENVQEEINDEVPEEDAADSSEIPLEHSVEDPSQIDLNTEENNATLEEAAESGEIQMSAPETELTEESAEENNYEGDVLESQELNGDESGQNIDWDSAPILGLDEVYSVEVTEEAPLAYFRILPEETAEYEIYSTGDLDTYGTLYDSQKTELESSDDDGDGSNYKFHRVTLDAGETYYLESRLYSNEAGQFSVHFEKFVLPEELKDAQNISVGDTFDVTVTEEHPYSYFVFTPDREFTYLFASSAADQAAVEMYDEQMQLQYAADSSNVQEAGTMRVHLLPGQTYYFKTGLIGDTAGSYTVSLSMADRASYNEEAIPLEIGSSASVELDASDKTTQYFQITPAQNGKYEFTTTAAGIEETVTQLYLYEQDGETNIGYASADSGNDINITSPLTGGNTYYLKLEFSGSWTDDENVPKNLFTISAAEAPLPDYMQNALEIHAGDSVDLVYTQDDYEKWLKFTPEESGDYLLYADSDQDFEVEVIACDADQESENRIRDNSSFSEEYSLEAGKTYYYCVWVTNGLEETVSHTIHLVSNQSDEWLKDYDYNIEDDRIILCGYHGEESDVRVPGHAMCRETEYDRIQISPHMWPDGLTSLSFEEGVEFPEFSDDLFANMKDLAAIDLTNIDFQNVKSMNDLFYNCRSLTSIDLSSIDFTGINSCYHMFSGCVNLQTIETPIHVSESISLPRKYYDEAGNAYEELPTDLTESITLTKAEESAWLADYDYSIEDDAIVLQFYRGDKQEIVVPGTAEIGEETYNIIRVGENIWNADITSITFEEGVYLQEYCAGLFSGCWNLEMIDMSKVNFSNVYYADGMFEDCHSLETVYTPAELGLEIALPVPFTDTSGNLWTSLPMNRSASIELNRPDVSEWLDDYIYTVEDGTVILKEYLRNHYEEAGIVDVPGKAEINGIEYSPVIPQNNTWAHKNISEITFQEGVSFPEDVTQMFDISALKKVDLSCVDFSNVSRADNIFGQQDNEGSLQEIQTPKNVNIDIPLYAAYTDESGNLFSSLPMNLQESIRLTKAEAGDELADYTYAIQEDRIKLLSYHGEDTNVMVPGHAMIGGKQYSATELSSGMWVDRGWNIQSIDFEEGVLLPENCTDLFRDLYNIRTIDISKLDCSHVTCMAGMFADCSQLESITWGDIDTSAVTDMHEMFADCSSLAHPDLTVLDTSHVTDMSSMFNSCSSMTDFSFDGFNTSNVTDMSGMFQDCVTLTRIDLQGLDTGAVTNMSSMFGWCRDLTELDLSGLNVSNVTDMNELCYGCSNLASVNMHGLNAINVTDMNSMFYDCESLTQIDFSGIKTGAVSDLSYMFRNCSSLEEADLSSISTVNVTNTRSMFRNCRNLGTLNISGFDLSKLEHKGRMFEGCKALTTIYAPKNVTLTVELPAVFEGTDGKQYRALPISLTESIVLLWASELSPSESGNPSESGDPSPETKVSLNDADITLSGEEFTYNGDSIEPEVTVTVGGTQLSAGTDYTVEYHSNTNAGNAYVVVTGTGNYTDSKQAEFTILKAEQVLSAENLEMYEGESGMISVTGNKGSLSYQSKDKSIAATELNGKVNAVKAGNTTVTITAAETDNYQQAEIEITVSVLRKKTGWIEEDGERFYYDSDGTKRSDAWAEDGTNRYWMDSEGKITKNKWVLTEGSYYYMDADGNATTGWKSIGGAWYYMDQNGIMQTGWQSIGGKWYYMDRSGAMQTGWQSISGTWYYFNGSGAMQTGWQSISGTWYYFNGSGAMQTGWQSIGGKWYYFASGGAMTTGWQSIGGKWYYFTSSGAMATGWQTIGGKYYYFESSGVMAANKWVGNYYLTSSGVMATNTWIGNYYVDGTGKWVRSR